MTRRKAEKTVDIALALGQAGLLDEIVDTRIEALQAQTFRTFHKEIKFIGGTLKLTFTFEGSPLKNSPPEDW